MPNAHSQDECRVKERKGPPSSVTWFDQRIAKLKGQKVPMPRIEVRYVRGEASYVALSGGFEWPGDDQPGFAVVVGAKGSNPVRYEALAEVEDQDPWTLLEEAHAMWREWGANCAVVPWRWWGDTENAMSRFSLAFNRKMKRGKINLNPPPQYDQPNRMEVYVRLLLSLANVRRKRVIVSGACPKLLSALQVFEKARDRRANVSHPQVMAFGYVVAGLEESAPWERRTPEPDMDSDEFLATMNYKTDKALERELDGHGYDFDADGVVQAVGLVPTIGTE